MHNAWRFLNPVHFRGGGVEEEEQEEGSSKCCAGRNKEESLVIYDAVGREIVL